MSIARSELAVVAKPHRSNGWWGMAMLVTTESALFACLIASYFYLRFQATLWPPASEPHPRPLVPLILTAVLVSTTLPMHLASRAAAQGRLAAVRLGLAVSTLLAAGYLAVQLYRFVDALGRLDPRDGAYPSIVNLLAGGHHTHVAAGLVMSSFLLLRLRTGLTPYRSAGVQAVALYWYVVNALAVAVTLTLLSPSL